ncbi:MAG: hypothetical protein IMY76_07850 [Chloroflexi bacterium]|nr:hypothetical protein [Chloroflexota bacterium]
MKAKFRWIIYLIVVLTVIVLTKDSALAQNSERSQFFPDTGHSISGDFLSKFTSIRNPLEIYGQPITEEFLDQNTGRLIQYFEKTRFEYHPDEIPGLQVQLSVLGDYLYEPGDSLHTPSNSPACRYFPGTDFPVCYAFLDFFEENGGTAQFGYPISGFESHDGRISQYFNRARFEWHPEYPPGERVLVSDLGMQYFSHADADPTHLQPITRDDEHIIVLNSISRLRVHAFTGVPIVRTRTRQSVVVIVRDQNLNPLDGAIVTVTITYPNGDTELLAPIYTESNGVGTGSLVIRKTLQGTAVVSVEISYLDLSEHTHTAFQLW